MPVVLLASWIVHACHHAAAPAEASPPSTLLCKHPNYTTHPAHGYFVQGRPVMLHLWDVAGSQLNAQPCHHGLFGDGADGVMYVMDVTSRESLQAVDDWDRALSRVRFVASHYTTVVLSVAIGEPFALLCSLW